MTITARFASLALLVALCVCAASAAYSALPFTISAPPNPAFASVFGKEIVRISGSGFTSFSYAQCVWGEQYISYAADIISDTVVECETPAIPEADLAQWGVPFTTSLKIVFDGMTEFSSSVSSSFRFGPTITSVSPTSSTTAGGILITLTGTAFNGYPSQFVEVGNEPCTELRVLSATQIECRVPAGEFNQDAPVVLRYNSVSVITAPQTFHYGPIITSISPRCGDTIGSTLVTLSGVNLDDPLINPATFPIGAIEVVTTIGAGAPASSVGTLQNGVITFLTPPNTVVNTFGQSATFTVYFKPLNSRVAVGTNSLPLTFAYGPRIYSVGDSGPYPSGNFSAIQPALGHRGGGDRITIYGCGFGYHSRAQIEPLLNFNSIQRPLCFRGPAAGTPGDSLQVYSNGNPELDRIECITNAFDCTATSQTSNVRDVTIQFTNQLGTSTPATIMPFTPGPLVDSISPTRGPFNGGETISIIGRFFFSSSNSRGWNPRVRFASQLMGGTVVTRNANLISDTLITVVTPSVFRFGESVTIDIDFVSATGVVLCGQIPRLAKPTYSFGATCTAVTPASGPLSGGNLVSLTGVGFTRGRLTASTSTVVQVCIQRLNPTLTATGCGKWEQISTAAADGFLLTDTAIVFRMPSIRQSVQTVVGGNRLFGDTALVIVSFTDVGTTMVATGTAGPYATCGTYRFGPITTTVTPAGGPNGPRAADSPLKLITVRGSNLDDPLYRTNPRIDIGTVGTVGATVLADGSQAPVINANTLWGGAVGSLNDVRVTFDTCNTTVSTTSVAYGPAVTSLIGPSSTVPQAGDVWGLLPAGGQTITVVGSGFNEFTGNVRCLIDGVPTAGVVNGAGDQIACTTPPRAFGTPARVSVQFGTICGQGATPRYDWSQTLDLTQRAFYTPRITSFTPTFGPTSGNTIVTINGEGLSGWPAYFCYFGHYSNRVLATAGTGSSLSCATPTQRGEFNTDVTVHVLLSADPSQNHWKVVAPRTYHYGPVCTGVTPQLGLLNGNQLLTLVGAGFQDCITTNVTQPIIRNCTMNNFRVNFYDRTSGQLTFSSSVNSSLTSSFSDSLYLTLSPPATRCQQNLRVEIEYLDPIVTNSSQRFVQCGAVGSNTTVFGYGPRFVSQSSQYHRNGISYGWQGAVVTITGVNFHDPAIWSSDASVACLFGNRPGVLVGATSDTTITCSAPAGAFDELVNVTVTWNGGRIGCSGPTSLVAGRFHWGPVIDAITPTFGFVAGGTPVTVSGFAFDCCGISSVRCLFPEEAPLTTTISATTAVCNVPTNIYIDRQINNIGLGFASALFPSTNNTGTGNSTSIVSTLSQLTLTESNDVLTYYYGPIVTSVLPQRVRLSGLQSITITGAGFADPYLTGTFCDYFTNADATQVLPATPTWNSTNLNTVSGAVTNTQIVCPVRQYAHQCGDIDSFRVRWSRSCSFVCGFRNELRNNYFKTVAALPPPRVKRFPYYTDAGSAIPITTAISFGPTIVSVTSTTNPSLRFPTSGGGTVTVTADSFGDWVSGSPTRDFGSETALCLFGHLRSPAVSVISGTSNSVTCTVPPGAFDFRATVAVILDPKTDNSTVVPSAYRWQPYVTSLNKDWSIPEGDEVIVVNGAGFCNWASVVCVFGNDVFGRVDAYRSVIIDDRTIECVSPARSPGTISVELHFCHAQNAPCSTAGSKDVVVASTSFAIVGVTRVTPEQVSTCGNTPVTLVGFGFSRFENFECVIGNQRVPARYSSDSAVVCEPLKEHEVSCNHVALVAELQSVNYKFQTDLIVEYTLPEIVSVSPTVSDIDESRKITVYARHLEGSDFAGTYNCRFGSIVVPGELTVARNPAGGVQQVLTCQSPTRAAHPALVTSDTQFEASFNCFDARTGLPRFTESRIPYTFTQNPTITTVTPAEGTELGATAVTIFGTQFHGGSGYFCAFGQPDQPDFQVVSATYLPDGVPESRGAAVITCTTPARIITGPTAVPVHISVDNGKTFVTAPTRFRYDFALIECNEVVISSSAFSSLSAAPSLRAGSMLLALVALVQVLLVAF